MEMANFTSGAQGAHTAVFKHLIVGIKTYRWNDRLTSTWFLPIGCAGGGQAIFRGGQLNKMIMNQ